MLSPGLVRLLLASVVILFHITKFVFLGSFAVFCFFILSGYWVTFMYEKKYSRLESSLKVFYISRAWRLFPILWLFTIITVLFNFIYKPTFFTNFISQDNLETIRMWVSNLFLLGLNQTNTPKLLVPAWSLDIEIQYYIVFPLIVAFIPKRGTILLLFTGLVTIFLTIYYPGSILSNTILYYLFYFLLGSFIYFKKVSVKPGIELAFNIAFIIILLVHYFVPGLKELTVKDPHSTYNFYLNCILPLVLIPLLSNSVQKRSSSIDRMLGNLSYIVYLCHWALMVPYINYAGNLPLKQKMLYTAFYLLAVAGISYLIYIFYDKPIDASRKKWVDKARIKA